MKNIKINEELHATLRDFCKEHGFKVGAFAEIAIKTAIKKQKQKDEED